MSIRQHVNPSMGPRYVCSITTVEPKTRKIEAKIKDGGEVLVSVFDIPPFFVWPQVNERWIIRKDGNYWKLDTRLDTDLDHSFDRLNPGEGKIGADIIKTPTGKTVIAIDNLTATEGQVIGYKSGSWVPIDQTGGTDTGSANTIRYGATVPSDSLGSNGDFYINTNNNYIYGPKASNSWPAGTSLVGPTGLTGPTGAVASVTTNAGSGITIGGTTANPIINVDTTKVATYSSSDLTSAITSSYLTKIGPLSSGAGVNFVKIDENGNLTYDSKINNVTITDAGTGTTTLTLANGSTLATSGANSLTFTTTATTNITLPAGTNNLTSRSGQVFSAQSTPSSTSAGGNPIMDNWSDPFSHARSSECATMPRLIASGGHIDVSGSAGPLGTTGTSGGNVYSVRCIYTGNQPSHQFTKLRFLILQAPNTNYATSFAGIWDATGNIVTNGGITITTSTLTSGYTGLVDVAFTSAVTLTPGGVYYLGISLRWSSSGNTQVPHAKGVFSSSLITGATLGSSTVPALSKLATGYTGTGTPSFVGVTASSSVLPWIELY